jgi:hypothetical protein
MLENLYLGLALLLVLGVVTLAAWFMPDSQRTLG